MWRIFPLNLLSGLPHGCLELPDVAEHDKLFGVAR
jgi:hypothetical protein